MIVHTPLDVFSILVYGAVLVAAVGATIYRPRYGVAVLIVLVPFAFYRDIGETTLTLSKVALVGIAIATFVRAAPWRGLSVLAARQIIVATMLLAVAAALSIWHANYMHPAVRETLKYCEYLLLFGTVYIGYRIDPDSGLIRTAFCAVVAVVSVLALAQEFLGAPSGLLINHHVIPRIAGPLEGPNQLAGYLEVALPLLLAFASKPSRALTIVLALATCAEVLTFSRGGIFAAAAAIIVVFLNMPREASRQGLKPILVGGAAGFVVVIFWGAVAESLGILRLWSFQEVNYAGGVGTRRELWTAAIKLWKAHPVFGIGAGNFELEIADVGPRNVRTHANSLYLQSLVEMGIPGLLATLYLIWRSVASFIARRLASPLILGALAASVALAIHQFADLLIFYPKVGGMWWIVMALASAEVAHSSTNGAAE